MAGFPGVVVPSWTKLLLAEDIAGRFLNSTMPPDIPNYATKNASQRFNFLLFCEFFFRLRNYLNFLILKFPEISTSNMCDSICISTILEDHQCLVVVGNLWLDPEILLCFKS